MAISAGEVNSTLRFTVNEADVAKVQQTIASLQAQFAALGGSTTLAGQVMATAMAGVTTSAQALQTQLNNTAGSIGNVSTQSNQMGTSLSSVEGILSRMAIRIAAVFVVKEIASFTLDIFKAAEAVTQLSERTEASVTELKRLEGVGASVGVPVTQIASDILNLTKNLALMKAGTADALSDIGLNFTTVGNTTDQQINRIFDAIARLPTHAQRVAVEMKLGLGDAADALVEKWASIPKGIQYSIDKSGEEVTAKLNSSVEMYRGYWEKLKDIAAKGIVGIQNETQKIATPWFMPQDTGMPGTGGNPTTTGQTPHVNPNNIPHIATNAKVDGGPDPNYIETLTKKESGLTDEMIRQMTILKSLNELTADQAAKLNLNGVSLGITTPLFKEFTQLLHEKEAIEKKDQEAMEKWLVAADDINSAGADWKSTINGIDGAIVEEMRTLTAAGVSLKNLELFYGLTTTQGRAFTAMLRDEASTLRQEQTAISETTRLWDEYDLLLVQRSGTATDQQMAAVDKWAADLTAKMSKAHADTNEFYDALAATVTEKYNKIMTDTKVITDAVTNHSKEGLQQIADKAQKTYEDLLGRIGTVSQASIDAAHQEAMAAQKAADSWGTATEGTTAAVGKLTTAVQSGTAKQVAAIQSVTNAYYQQIDAAFAAMAAATGGFDSSGGHRPGTPNDGSGERGPGINQGPTVPINGGSSGGPPAPFQNSPHMPVFDKGGPTSEGPAYVHDGEYVIPKGGALVMGSKGGGDTYVANLSGIMMSNDPSSLAAVEKMVNKALTSVAKQNRKFPSA